MEIRSTAQRVSDVRAKLASDCDLWVASANATGDAYLVPLSFSWDGEYLTVATPQSSRTARNLRRAGWARMALGPTRDVVIVEGPVEEMAVTADDALADAHAAAVGFDARDDAVPYVFIRLKAQRIQAWRNNAEIAGRDVLRDGHWLA
jgi:hypothetical protein